MRTFNGDKPWPRKRPVDWNVVKRVLAVRREHRRMTQAGYTRHETDWEIVRGSRQNEVIVDVVISNDGKNVWTKLGNPTPAFGDRR